ncbi:MAG: hypothetical protein ABIN96_01460, partial [Rubrivivax sp.]
LAPLHEALSKNAWPNRDLLLVPLGSGTAMAAQGARLGRGSSVAVHVTPHAERPKEVWTFISGAWNRLHGRPGGERALHTDLSLALPKAALPASEAATEPMPLQPMGGAAARHDVPPGRSAPLPMPVPGATRWQSYVDRCMVIKGSTACCVFDLHSMKPLAHTGHGPAPERLAQQGSILLTQAADAARALGLGSSRPEASFGIGGHHLLLMPVSCHPGVAVFLVIQASTGNPSLARMQLQRLEAPR